VSVLASVEFVLVRRDFLENLVNVRGSDVQMTAEVYNILKLSAIHTKSIASK